MISVFFYETSEICWAISCKLNSIVENCYRILCFPCSIFRFQVKSGWNISRWTSEALATSSASTTTYHPSPRCARCINWLMNWLTDGLIDWVMTEQIYTTACFLLTCAVQMDLLTPFHLYFNPSLIFVNFQVGIPSLVFFIHWLIDGWITVMAPDHVVLFLWNVWLQFSLQHDIHLSLLSIARGGFFPVGSLIINRHGSIHKSI